MERERVNENIVFRIQMFIKAGTSFAEHVSWVEVFTKFHFNRIKLSSIEFSAHRRVLTLNSSAKRVSLQNLMRRIVHSNPTSVVHERQCKKMEANQYAQTS